MTQARIVETVDGQVIITVAHDRMTAWACVNAIMAFTGRKEVLFGEWRDAVGDEHWISPVDTARRILAWRGEAA